MKALREIFAAVAGWLYQTLLLAGRQIVDQIRLWWVSLVIGILPFLAPYLPTLSEFPAADVRQTMTLVLGGFFGLVFLLVLGSGFLAQDLAERRLGFFFARPVAASSLAFGRLLGAWCVALGCQVLLFPALWLAVFTEDVFRKHPGDMGAQPLTLLGDPQRMMMAMHEVPAPLSWATSLVVWALALALILLLVHALNVWLRVRSSWMLLDGLGMVICGALGWGAVRRLEGAQSFGVLVLLERGTFVVLLVSLLIALWVQVQWGRNHLTRAHRFFSLTLWPILILAALAADGYSRFVVSPKVEDLTRLEYIHASPSSHWMLVGGPTRWRGGTLAGFLVDYETQRSWNLGGLDIAAAWFTLSGDGSRAAWMRCKSLSKPTGCEVWSMDLEAESPEPRATGIRYDSYPRDVELSPEGERLAVAWGRTLEVFDLEPASVLSAQRLEMQIEEIFFLNPYRLRLGGFLEATLEDTEDLGRTVAEVDIEGNRYEITWRLPDYLRTYRIHRREGLDLLFYQTLFPPSIALVDGASGEVRVQRPVHFLNASRFLEDGRLVLLYHRKESRRLICKVFAPTGEELSTVEFQDVEDFSVGGEWSPGRLWLGLKGPSAVAASEPLDASGVVPLDGWTLNSLVVESGELRPVQDGIRPLFDNLPDRSLAEHEVGSPATRLFVAGEGAIVYWEPETRRGRRVLQPRNGDSNEG